MAKTADYLVEELNAKVLFISMVLGNGQNDEKIAEEIIQRMKYKRNTKILSSDYKPRELMGIIGETELLLGTRMHALILASAMNVPVVGVIYQSKMKSFLQMIGQESRAIDIEDISFDKMVNIIDDTWNNRGQIKEDIKPKVEELQKRASSNVDFVLKLLEYPKKM